MLSLIAVVAFVGAWGYLWYRGVEQQYAAVKQQADSLQTRYQTEASSLRPGDLPQLTLDLAALEAELEDLRDRVDIPLVSSVARHTPYVKDTYRSSEDLIALGLELTSIARETSEIANEVRAALETGGIRYADDGQVTWLDALTAREGDIYALEQRLREAVELRAGIDPESLPPRGRTALQSADQLIERATHLRDEYFDLLPLLPIAFGRDTDVHYLILLQNGEEIRPAGGFPGTFGLLTLSNGRIRSLEIDDIRTLDRAYYEQRPEPLGSPGPIATYLRQEEWLPHDALWSPDFAEAARAFLQMYGQTGWPELRGVVGVNHGVVEQVLRTVGAFEVDLAGERQTVTPENYLAVIETYRDLTWQDLAVHKRVVRALGTALLDQIAAASFETKKDLYFRLRAEAGRREVQAYFTEPRMQAEVVERGWDGPLALDPTLPTMAVTVASVAGGKASTAIFPAASIEIRPGTTDGMLRVAWQMGFEHRGDPRGEQTYHGFQRLWVSVYLPGDARVISTSRAREPDSVNDDPRALGFNVGAMPGATSSLLVVFEVPAADALLLRRQPGMNDSVVTVDVSLAGCRYNTTWTATTDLRLDVEQCGVRFAR